MSEIGPNKTFCIMPWVNLHVQPNSSISPCCAFPFEDSFGDVSRQSFKDIWNGPKFRELRKQLLNGESPEGCKQCYFKEEGGFISLRQLTNARFKKDCRRVLFNGDPDGTAELKLKALDVRFSNLCNLKCRSCSPNLSSAWYEDYLNLGRISPDTPKVRNVQVDSPNFWKELHEIIDDVEYVYIAGGEPLITKEHYELLRFLISRGKTDIHLVYNTNLTTLNYDQNNLIDLWKQFKKVVIGISVDDIGKRAEYTRHGCKWEVIEQNMLTLKTSAPNILTQIHFTVSALNIFYVPEFFEYLYEKKPTNTNFVFVSPVQDPHELCIDAFPQAVKLQIKEKLENFITSLEQRGLKNNIFDIKNLISTMMKKDNSHHFPYFLENSQKLDQLRKESFKDTFPELTQLISL